MHDASAPQSGTDTNTGTLKLLSTLSRDIALTSENLGESLNTLLTRAAEQTNTDALAVWTIDPESDELSIEHAVGLSDRLIRYFNHTDRIRLGKGVIGLSAQDAITASLETARDWSTLGPERWCVMFDEEGISSLVVVPMRIGDRPVGAVTALHKQRHAYDAHERFFFEVLANQVAIALANYRNFRSISRNRAQLEDQIAKLTNLQDSFEAINRYLNQSVEHALEYLAHYVQETFRGQGVAMFEPNEAGTTLHMTGSSGLPEEFQEHLARTTLTISNEPDTLVAAAFQTQEMQLSERLFTDDRVGRRWIRLLSENHITAEASFPLAVEDRSFGVLAVFYDHLHPYTEEETSVLGAFSQFFGILYENQKIFASLVAEKQKTQAIVYSLRDGLIAYDLDGVITDANPRAAELLGLPRDKLVGRTPHVNTGAEDNLTRVTRLAIPDFAVKTLSLKQPAHELEVTQVPLHEASYRKTGTLRILHDVTEERRAEYLKTNFVSTATHQLRTPLTGLNWALDSLASGTVQTEEKRAQLIEQMRTTTKYVISLVNDLLSVSEIEEGRVQYQFERQSVLPIIRSIVEEIQVEVTKKKQQLTLDAPPDDAAATAVVDRTRMTLALQNIIDNAVRYTPEGGSVTIRVTPSPNTLLISVTDTGIGISKDDQKLLFNKFFRAENAVRVVPDGSGLGLFLTKGIVEDHNGRIWVDSVPEQGTTFYIQLPLDEEQLPQQQQATTGDN